MRRKSVLAALCAPFGAGSRKGGGRMSNTVSRLLARARSLFCRKGGQTRRDPDLRAMSGARLHEFLRSLKPVVSAAERAESRGAGL